MKKLFLKLSLAIVAMLLLTNADVLSQNFTNNGGTYNATCGAVIKLNSADAAPITYFNGSTPLGGTPIPGVVEYAYPTASANDQTVQPLQYTFLVLSGLGNKIVADGVEVFGDDCEDFLSNDYAYSEYFPYFNNATPTYVGTFTYGGSGQNIWPDTYNDVDVNDGPATILALDPITSTPIVVTVNTMTTDGSSDLTVSGVLNLGAGDSEFGSLVTLNDDDAEINAGAGTTDFADLTVTTGSINAQSGDGIVTFGGTTSLASSTSILNFGEGTFLEIAGAITNDGDGTNLIFFCDDTDPANASTVTYLAGSTTVLPTLATNSYGNLVLTGGNKVGGNATNYANDINLCANFSLADGNLTMLTNGGTFRMNTPIADATYAGLVEVIGNFNRAIDASLETDYTFNNAGTMAIFDAADDNPERFQFFVDPATTSFQYVADTDVSRKVTVTYTDDDGSAYSGTGFDNFALSVGYKDDENPNLGWAAPYTQASIRMWETNASDEEKVASGTGIAPARSDATVAAFGSVRIDGIENTTDALPNTLPLFASGNDIILRAGPTTFYTIADGRWTNPNVWDELVLPTEFDDTYLRHMIYVGISGPFAGTLVDNNTTPETSEYGTDPAANTITIMADNVNNDFPNSSLIIGNEDNAADYVHRTRANGASFQNLNTLAAGAAFPYEPTDKTAAAKIDFNGLWLVGGIFAIDSRIPAFGTNPRLLTKVRLTTKV